MRRSLLTIGWVVLLLSCATEDPPRLDVRVHGRAFADAAQLVFQLRIGEGQRRAVGGRVYALTPEGIDLAIGPAEFGLRDADIRGPVAVYVVACRAGEARCDTDDLINTPTCTCDAPLAVGLGQALVEGLTRLDIFLDPFDPQCDADGDLFLDCDREGCCGSLDPAVVHDCDDVRRDCGGEARCDGRFAHPFHAAELAFDATLTDAHRARHQAWCGDGLDNDCDGIDVACGGDDADGDGVPAPADCDDADATRFPGNVEDAQTRCSDGVDNDCDGGDVRCDLDSDGADDLSDCDDANADRFPNNPERCGDGVDQDCDEYDPPCISADLDGDGYLCPVANPWDVHACSGNGADGRPKDCNDLDAGIFPGAPERCNGIDDDCDEAIDEGCPSPEDDADRDGVASVNNGGADCDDADPAVYPGAPERCGDGIDQDCNGRDMPCDTDVDGDGYDARVDCRDGDPAVHPGATEWCNGEDDDCDGRVDEGDPRQTLPEGPIAPDECGFECLECACRVAPYVCSSNGGSNPVGQRYVCLGVDANQIPETICDGIDQDCDGAWDEAVERECYSSDPGEIGTGICVRGIEECRAERGSGTDAWGVCAGEMTPVREICNGLDDDCDASTDEGVLTRPCYTGRPDTEDVGLCRGGINRCEGAADFSQVCEGEVLPRPERCNGLNDDCDANTDEGFGLGDECFVGRGECRRSGQRICDESGDESRCDATAGRPREEVCNGLNDDCDANTDEGVLNACGECGAVPVEICNDADDDCDGDTDEGVRNACDRCGPVPPEVCNGRDDDCDGQTDEGVLNACGECGAVPAEICNGEDDDCDGNTDERLPLNACRTCGPAPQEVCNGDDDDCDGDNDEGVLNACGECGAVPAEACDDEDEDEDCDGRVNEGFNVGSDLDHCAGCNVTCNRRQSDACVDRECRCGDSAECQGMQRCRNGACQ